MLICSGCVQISANCMRAYHEGCRYKPYNYPRGSVIETSSPPSAWLARCNFPPNCAVNWAAIASPNPVPRCRGFVRFHPIKRLQYRLQFGVRYPGRHREWRS